MSENLEPSERIVNGRARPIYRDGLTRTQYFYQRWGKAYKQKNPDKVKEWNRKIREKFGHIYLARVKEKVRCEVCNVEVCRAHLSRHNKSKQHVENTGQEYVIPESKARLQAKVFCECGSEIQEGNRLRHYRSYKHQDYLERVKAIQARCVAPMEVDDDTEAYDDL